MGGIERVQIPTLVAGEKNVSDMLEEDVADAREWGETQARLGEPASSISREIVPCRQMKVVQDRYPG